jgi:hypothetical protein
MQVRNAKALDRAYKLFDERGLFLLVTPAGRRLWRFRYRIGNREKLLSLGIYPDVPLKRVREKRDEARRMVADEIDPSAERKARREAMLVTFEGVAQEWLELQSKSLSSETLSILGARLNSGLYPYLGSARSDRSRPSKSSRRSARSKRGDGMRQPTGCAPWRAGCSGMP